MWLLGVGVVIRVGVSSWILPCSLQIRTMLDQALNNATQDFNFNSTSFLPDSVQNSLEDFRNSSVEQINITGGCDPLPPWSLSMLCCSTVAFREQITAPLLMFDINMTISTLMNISQSLMMAQPAMTTSLRMSIADIITQLETIRDDQIPEIEVIVVC